jgi:hypothetical protein
VSDTPDFLRAELAGLAAQFVLPGLGPSVDRAIKMACELVVADLDTPATVDVAAISPGTPMRDAGPAVRTMLDQQGFPTAEAGASDDDVLLVLLRGVAAGGLEPGEFFNVFMQRVPPWQEQDELERSLVVLLNDWVDQTSPEGKTAALATLRRAARDALTQAG